MGTNYSAIIFYGFCWTDLNEAVSEMEWAERIAISRGITAPDYSDYPTIPFDTAYENARALRKAWEAAHPEVDVYHKTVAAIHTEFGVDIGWHCSIDYAIPYIYIKESEQTSWSGDAHEFDPTTLVVDATWVARLARFIEINNIDLEDASGPGWFLVTNRG